jgi:hypothetical protein
MILAPCFAWAQSPTCYQVTSGTGNYTRITGLWGSGAAAMSALLAADNDAMFIEARVTFEYIEGMILNA